MQDPTHDLHNFRDFRMIARVARVYKPADVLFLQFGRVHTLSCKQRYLDASTVVMKIANQGFYETVSHAFYVRASFDRRMRIT